MTDHGLRIARIDVVRNVYISQINSVSDASLKFCERVNIYIYDSEN